MNRTIALLALTAAAIIGCSSLEQSPPPATNEMIGTDLPATTTTTIDLSFLNTTTTTHSQTKNLPPQPQPTGDVWSQLAQCETGGNWNTNTGNGFSGGLQFAHTPAWSTWRAYGGDEFATNPHDASMEQQIAIAERVRNSVGWSAWPGCARLLGLY